MHNFWGYFLKLYDNFREIFLKIQKLVIQQNQAYAENFYLGDIISENYLQNFSLNLDSNCQIFHLHARCL